MRIDSRQSLRPQLCIGIVMVYTYTLMLEKGVLFVVFFLYLWLGMRS